MYTIAMIPPESVRNKADNYRKRYDTQYGQIPAHIKLVEPFEYPEENISDLISRIKEIAAKSRPVTLSFHRIGTFYPANPVIYFGIQDKSDIINLHHALLEKIPQARDHYAYVPHLTIARDLPNDELHDVYGRLKMLDIDMTCEIREIHLLVRQPQEKWEEVESFTLG